MPKTILAANALALSAEPAISRRLLFAYGAVTAAVAVMPSAGAASGSDPIEAKYVEYLRMRDIADAAYNAQADAEESITLPELPGYSIAYDAGDRLFLRKENGGTYSFCDPSDKNIAELEADVLAGEAISVVDFDTIHLKQNAARASRTLAKIKAYRLERDRIEQSVNLPELQARADKLCGERYDMAKEIFAMKATTPRGLAIQADVVLYDFDNQECRELLGRIRNQFVPFHA